VKKIIFKLIIAALAAVIFIFVLSQNLVQNFQKRIENKAEVSLGDSVNSQPKNSAKVDFLPKETESKKTELKKTESKKTKSKKTKSKKTKSKKTKSKKTKFKKTKFKKTKFKKTKHNYVSGSKNSSFYKRKPRKKIAKNQISASQKQPEASKTPDEKQTDLLKKISASKIKTQGHYFGVSGILNELNYHEENSTFYSSKESFKPSSSGNGTGIGFGYKYALNFDDFFIAPGFFYEKLNTSVKGSRKAYGEYYDLTKADIKDRYGFVADVGYDFNKFISPYVTVGYSWTKYQTKNGIPVDDGTSQIGIEKSTAGSYVYGLGVKTSYNQNISFNFELQTQSLNLKTNTDISVNDFGYKANYKGRLNTVKLGAFYNF
jgi:opacity protein-like surface antigen